MCDIWGLTTSETEEKIRDEMQAKDKKRMSIACIGPAGENLVRYAGIINEKRAHGRGGAGAVMGSKNLKAVVAMGNRKIQLADEEAFKSVVQRCRQKIAEHPMVGKGGVFPRMGTMMTIELTNETGALPTRNWQENTFDSTPLIDGEAFLKYAVHPRACYACPIGCTRDTKVVREGKEYITEGPDYETMYAFGPNCEIKDPASLLLRTGYVTIMDWIRSPAGSRLGLPWSVMKKGFCQRRRPGA